MGIGWMNNQTDKQSLLEDLIQEREEAYGELTIAMFSEIGNCIDAIVMLFDGVLHNFQWSDIEFDSENNILIITATAAYVNPIINVQTAGGEMKVPTLSQNGLLARKDIYVGIPMELVLESNEKEIYQFLVETESRRDAPMFSTENTHGHTIPLNANEQIFDEIYEEIEKSKKRVLH